MRFRSRRGSLSGRRGGLCGRSSISRSEALRIRRQGSCRRHCRATAPSGKKSRAHRLLASRKPKACLTDLTVREEKKLMSSKHPSMTQWVTSSGAASQKKSIEEIPSLQDWSTCFTLYQVAWATSNPEMWVPLAAYR